MAFASEFFAATVYEELADYVENVGVSSVHGELAKGMKLVMRALHLIANCHDAGVTGADAQLLELATTYDIDVVRRAAIRTIETRGDAAMKTALRAAVQPDDEGWLDPEPFPENKTFALDPDDPALTDHEEVPR